MRQLERERNFAKREFSFFFFFFICLLLLRLYPSRVGSKRFFPWGKASEEPQGKAFVPQSRCKQADFRLTFPFYQSFSPPSTPGRKIEKSGRFFLHTTIFSYFILFCWYRGWRKLSGKQALLVGEKTLRLFSYFLSVIFISTSYKKIISDCRYKFRIGLL